jgi:NAD(P) transhydrogenase subunit alpha
MKIGILKEITPGETRIAATPETVSKLVKLGSHVVIQSGAGSLSFIHDDQYQNAGAVIVPDAETVSQQVNIILKVQKPIFDHTKNRHEIDFFPTQSTLISPLHAFQNIDLLQRLSEKKISAFSLDLLPRIARAQSMDILSSMSNIAGYKSVLLAADHLSKLFPMMTTAAGTILPAKVIVIGAGVAGLQAIATARRLGGVVLAFDTRPIVAEQVKSLGADFVSLETTHEKSEDASGYAKEQTADFYKHEQDIIQHYLKDADVVITTALIPGKKAPLLITESMVKSMKPGSVIVDLAAEQDGNCQLTEPGKITTYNEVTIIGLLNLPSMLPIHASQLYSKNMLAFLQYVAPSLETANYDMNDDIVAACLITHQGDIKNAQLKQLLQQSSSTHKE